MAIDVSMFAIMLAPMYKSNIVIRAINGCKLSHSKSVCTVKFANVKSLLNKIDRMIVSTLSSFHIN